MRIAVLGCGNMASAIVKCSYAQNSDLKFFTYTPSKTRAIELAKKVNGTTFDSIKDLPQVDMVIIACKPQQLSDLAKELKNFLLKDQLVVSILAAVDIQTLQQQLEIETISRIMPNTPCEIGLGISLMHHSDKLTLDQKNCVKSFFELCSKVVEVKDDKELDLLTIVSGCGPAYVFEFARSMQNFLTEHKISKEVSKELINQLFVGASQLMSNLDLEYDELIKSVTSKGGVTIEAIETFRKNNLLEITSLALNNALKKSERITQETANKSK